jgi:Na+/proline symporter
MANNINEINTSLVLQKLWFSKGISRVDIGGEIARYKEQIVASRAAAIQQNWSYPNAVECVIEFATLGDMAVAYGAAGMFLERFFSIPEVTESPGARASGIAALVRS